MCNDIKKETVCYVVAYRADHDCIASAIEHNALKIVACTEGFEYPHETAEFILQAVNKALDMDNALKCAEPSIVIGVCDKATLKPILKDRGTL